MKKYDFRPLGHRVLSWLRRYTEYVKFLDSKSIDNAAKNGTINYAKGIDIFNDYGVPKTVEIMADGILKELEASPIGKVYAGIGNKIKSRLRKAITCKSGFANGRRYTQG